MKTIIKLLAIIGFTSTVATAQVVTVTNASSGFLGQMQDMYLAQKELYTTNNPDSGYTEFIYATNYDPFFELNIGSGTFLTNAVNPQFPSTEDPFSKFFFNVFQKIDPNIDGFNLEGVATIGYFGNESMDKNELLVYAENGNQVQEITSLFSYAKPNKTPASGLNLDPGNSNNTTIRFYHRDNTTGDAAFQGEEAKFSMFQKLDPFTFEPVNEYVFFIDDRMSSKIDFDDGFFYLTGATSPVPEPAFISALAMAGLGGILIYRRKRTTNK